MNYYLILVSLIGSLTFIRVHAQKLPRELTEKEYSEMQKRINGVNFKPPNTFKPKKLSSELKIEAAAGDLDSDHDWLTDSDEIKLGTDPQNPDTDEDGLLDGWEVNEVNGIRLYAMGASPLHKDIFVEMDYMVRQDAKNGLAWDDKVKFAIENAFLSAPVPNPDGQTGIRIHLIEGNEVPYDADLNPAVQEFLAIKEHNFDENRAPMFHYMIWANAYNGGNSSGNSFTTPSSDFIVTLGIWNNNMGGTVEQKIGTFIHELGHNLGLRHGGDDDVLKKPNHLSVMNYFFQMTGVEKYKEYYFMYQPFDLPNLNEPSLLESDGIGKVQSLKGYTTLYYDGQRNIQKVNAEAAIDWNNNTRVDAESIRMDVNGDFRYEPLRRTLNEYKKLDFRGGTIGKEGRIEGILEKSNNQLKITLNELSEDLANEIEKSMKLK